MIGYVSIGTNDLERASRFYDDLLSTIGAVRAIEHPYYRTWRSPTGGPQIMVTVPFNKAEAKSGNGNMIALKVESHDLVQRLHARALFLGGENEGEPGYRSNHAGFFAAYFRDLDRNKFCVFYVEKSHLASGQPETAA